MTASERPPDPSGLRIGSLFSGSGMLDEGVRSILGGTVAWHVENDPAASKVLAHRYPDIPNHNDVTAVDWAGVEPVDVLTGGFPCQDVSPAGKRAGLAPGTRSGLWAHFRAAIAILHPSLVVIENVRGLLSASAGRSPEARDPDLDPLTTHLMELSDAEADAARAGGDLGSDDPDVGDDDAARPVLLRALGAVLGDLAKPAGRLGAPLGADVDRRVLSAIDGDATRVGVQNEQVRSTPAGLDVGAVAGAVHRDRAGGPAEGVHVLGRAAAELAWGPYEPAIRRWERVLGRPAPAPTRPGSKGQSKLSPEFDEWLMGWPEGWASDVPGVSWNDVLAMCGNGVVPQQSAAAVRFMLARLAESLGRAA